MAVPAGRMESLMMVKEDLVVAVEDMMTKWAAEVGVVAVGVLQMEWMAQ
jgi:hypothetical protein